MLLTHVIAAVIQIDKFWLGHTIKKISNNEY